jgi:uncharacterized protein YhfF
MKHTSKTDAFWQNYLATLPADAKQHVLPYTVWDFADTPEAATKVGHLVRLGIKTTTSCLMWGMEHIGESLPEVGEMAVVVDGEGEPLCVIEVTAIEIKPFNAIDEQFAFEYGEGQRTFRICNRLPFSDQTTKSGFSSLQRPKCQQRPELPMPVR